MLTEQERRQFFAQTVERAARLLLTLSHMTELDANGRALVSGTRSELG